MNFSVEDEEELINVVAKHSVLYDAAHPEYRNILVKENIWNKIGKELNKSSDDCKKKWKFIRDAYQRYKKKNKLGTGSAAPKNTKDKRHQQLLFLDGVPQHRSGGSNVTESPQDSENARNADEEELVELEEKENDTPKKDKEEEPKKKRQKRTNTDDLVLKLWKERDSKRQELLKTMANKKDDDVALFCGHIAEVLRSLPPLFKAQAKKQLGIVLAEYEIMAAGSASYPNLASANPTDTNIASRTSSSMSQYSTTLSSDLNASNTQSSEGSSHAMPESSNITQIFDFSYIQEENPEYLNMST